MDSLQDHRRDWADSKPYQNLVQIHSFSLKKLPPSSTSSLGSLRKSPCGSGSFVPTPHRGERSEDARANEGKEGLEGNTGKYTKHIGLYIKYVSDTTWGYESREATSHGLNESYWLSEQPQALYVQCNVECSSGILSWHLLCSKLLTSWCDVLLLSWFESAMNTSEPTCLLHVSQTFENHNAPIDHYIVPSNSGSGSGSLRSADHPSAQTAKLDIMWIDASC